MNIADSRFTTYHAPSTTNLALELSSLGEAEGSIDFQSIELLTPINTATCAADVDGPPIAKNGTEGQWDQIIE